MPPQLDDENETLDWGNEEEEYQEPPRRQHYSAANAENDTFAGDDVEDTISLGDDDDDQRFYSISRHEALSSSASYNTAQPESPSSQARSTASGANILQQGRRSPKFQTPAANLSVQESVVNQDTPKNSVTRHSPPRSLPRLTHALPPKPVAASVIAAAATMTISPRSTGRDPKKINGDPGKTESCPESADLPQDWETRSSRKGETYYYNRVTHKCTWTHPGNNTSVVASSTQENSKSRRQRSVSPGGNKATVPYDSNTSHPQTSRSNRDFSRNGESEIEPRRRPLTPDENGLTFEDRHYRPGLDSVPMPDGIRGFDRSDIPTGAGRYARSSSPRWRKSVSPSGSKESDHFRKTLLPRDQRSAQEKPPQARTGSKLDSYVPDYESRRWPPSPPVCSPTDHHGRTQRERVPYASEEDLMQVDDRRAGLPPRKEDISRDYRQRSKDRDFPPARSSDVREPSASQNYFSAQRSRSPAPLPLPRERDHDTRDGRREAREHRYETSGPSIHDIHPLSARDGQCSELRQYEHSLGPRSDQDYAKGQDWSLDVDEAYSRGRNQERGKIREGERLERDRDRHNTRELNAGTDTDRSSVQRPPESYASELRGSPNSKRNAESFDRKADEPASARLKRTPLPPQQATFRSAKLRDAPPHPISTPSKRQEDNPRAVASVIDDAPPRQPRNSSSTVPLSSPDVSLQPNGVDPQRFPGQEHLARRELPYSRDETHADRRMNVTRDDASNFGRRQLVPPDRGLPDDLQWSPPIVPGGRERSPPTRAAIINDKGRRDLEHDKMKDERPMNRDSGGRDDKPELERSSFKRERDAPRQPARLTGTNNIPIGNRRAALQTGPTSQRPETMPSPAALPDPVVGPPSATRVLPPGKESYERPRDLVFSDPPRLPGPSTRTESSKNRDLRQQPQARQEDEARRQNTRPLAILGQHSNGSSYRASSPPPLSRDPSGAIQSKAPERPSVYPSSDGRPDVGFHPSQNPDLLVKSRAPYRQGDESTRWDAPRESRFSTYSPKHRSPDNAGGRPDGDPLPPRLRKSLSGGADPDLDARYISSGDSKRSPVHRSDFISRVEPPPLRRGGSLLDRLSVDTKMDRGLAPDSFSVSSPSLRDRLVPSKRDREEMMNSEGSPGRGGFTESQDAEGSDSKRARKRGGKRRSGGRRV